MTMTAQITTPFFVAGVVFEDGRVIKRAPILAKHIKLSWTAEHVWSYCLKKHWKLEIVARSET
jgi:hypothetical protein